MKQKDQNKPARRIRRTSGRSPVKVIFVIALLMMGIGVLAFSGYFLFLLNKLPKVDRLADYKPPIVSQVFGENGALVGEFYLERRIVVPVDKIPRKLVSAFVAAEDSNFYRHKGIDYMGIFRAILKNIVTMSKKEGASTITQQVAKSMLLSPEKTFTRKLKEAILAKRMEEKLSKDEILYIYLNQIYLGAGSYGVQEAAETYFGKDVDKLNLAEMAMLAGLPKAPNFYSPIKHLNRARERQAYVLERMVKEGFITPAEADHARKTPIVIRSMKIINSEQSAYFLENLRIQLEEKYGEDLLYKGGLKIYTTMNPEMQKSAYDSIVSGLKAVDKRQGFRGPIEYLAQNRVEEFCDKIEDGIDSSSLKDGETYQGVVIAVNAKKREMTVRVGDRTGTLSRKNMTWAGNVKLVDSYGKDSDSKRKSIPLGAVIEVTVLVPDKNKNGAVFALDQEPLAQAALVAVDPKSGAVRAMIGGYNFKKSQFNRAMQARRNPGSAFKPIIYAAALDKGMTPASIIDDSPVEYNSGNGKIWKPKNYDNNYRGPVTMREALTDSINVVSVKILENTGVDYAAEYAKKLGITSPITPNLTLALGSSSLTPLELTSAYAVFDSGGFRVTPYFVTKVVDGDGHVLEEYTPPPLPVFSTMSSAGVDGPGLTAQEGQPPVTDMSGNPVGAIPPATQAEQSQAGQSTDTDLFRGPARVISPATAYIITNLMESVVNSGTGQRARALGRPVAGKTGTTNDMKDAWFVGYVPQLVAGVWVGYDHEKSLGAGGSGGSAAAPIWTEFMKRALAGTPVQTFQPPPDVTFAVINPKTGLLARPGSADSVRECFIAGTEPKSYDVETPVPPFGDIQQPVVITK